MIACLKRYMSESGQAVSRAQFEENLAGKRNRHDFREDIEPLLRPGVTWDFDVAMNTVLERIIAELPGDPWKGAVRVETLTLARAFSRSANGNQTYDISPDGSHFLMHQVERVAITNLVGFHYALCIGGLSG